MDIYPSETCYDEDDNIIAQIIHDNKDQIVLFAMYPDIGGTVVVTITYDKQGNKTTKVFATFDEGGNLIDTVDMLAKQESLFAETLSLRCLSAVKH